MKEVSSMENLQDLYYIFSISNIAFNALLGVFVIGYKIGKNEKK